jgi:hypothetical protein
MKTIEDTMRNFLLATTLCLGATAAYAEGPDAYVGAGVTQAQTDDIFGVGHGLDLNNTAWKAYVGVRPISPLAVEADYMDLGSQTHHFGFDDPTHVDAHAFAAYAVGFLPLPLPFIDVFAKAGAARWDFSGHTNSSLFAIDDHGTHFAWGLGAQAHYGPWAGRLEYEQFNVPNTDGVKAVTVGLSFSLL